MKKKHQYVTWASIGKMSKEEVKEAEKRQAAFDHRDHIITNILVDHFDDLFRIDDNLNGKPVYIYDYASDWSDDPHLKIKFDNRYADTTENYWDVYRRGANSGETFDNPQDAFRWYLEGGTYDIDDLDKDEVGFPDHIEELIKKGLNDGT